jgi:hypothetical protein
MNRNKSTIMHVTNLNSTTHSRFRRAATLLLAVALLVTSKAVVAFAQQPQQRAFSSAEEATRALFAAAQNHDEAALMEILGAGSEVVSTGDALQDKLEREQFVQKYQEMHRLVREPDKTMVLYVGAENWPFPIPLVAANGVWRFDSQAGSNEVVCRRIGENEEMVVGDFRLLILAQQEYHLRSMSSVAEYTTRFIDPNGTHKALHWAGDSAIPVELARAGIDDQMAANSAVPFHGYYFRILTAQGKYAPGGAKSYVSDGKMTGGFAFVAYPAQYRSSGVKTFIAGSSGTVYEKDLGPETGKLAASMSAYDPGPGWHVAEQFPGESQ